MSDIKDIRRSIIDKSSALVDLFELLESVYGSGIKINNRIICDFLSNLHDDIHILVEFPYVDRVYRDSYYSYFAGKHKQYNRDSIRLSFFDQPITDKDFRSKDGIVKLQKHFIGFLVLRPTFPKIIGRSVIDPRALETNNLNICSVTIEVMINGVKLKVNGFPHATQDAETMSCAETTIWAIMEYFGHKYANYKPVLPLTIISTLEGLSIERQLPSKGLPSSHISYALKEFNFGVRMFQAYLLEQTELKRTLCYYVDSGLPVVVALQNDKVGHAVVYIGYEDISTDAINECLDFSLPTGTNLKIIDFADISKKYIVIDDNFPPYQRAKFSSPTSYYGAGSLFDECQIEDLIIPQHRRTHMEALTARSCVISILTGDFGWTNQGDQIIMRLFLTSSRSYKSHAAIDENMSDLLKELIVNSTMPKFIWIAEITNKENLLNKKIKGLIILDATSTSSDSEPLDSVVLIAYPDSVYKYFTDGMNKLSVTLEPFSLYNNLKGEFYRCQ